MVGMITAAHRRTHGFADEGDWASVFSSFWPFFSDHSGYVIDFNGFLARWPYEMDGGSAILEELQYEAEAPSFGTGLSLTSKVHRSGMSSPAFSFASLQCWDSARRSNNFLLQDV